MFYWHLIHMNYDYWWSIIGNWLMQQCIVWAFEVDIRSTRTKQRPEITNETISIALAPKWIVDIWVVCGEHTACAASSKWGDTCDRCSYWVIFGVDSTRPNHSIRCEGPIIIFGDFISIFIIIHRRRSTHRAGATIYWTRLALSRALWEVKRTGMANIRRNTNGRNQKHN